MRMLKSNLLVKKLTREQLGKIVMPESVEDEWLRGEVMGVGPEVSASESKESQVKIGDIVIFPPLTPYGNPHPAVGDDGYIIIPETYIWAIED